MALGPFLVQKLLKEDDLLPFNKVKLLQFFSWENFVLGKSFLRKFWGLIYQARFHCKQRAEQLKLSTIMPKFWLLNLNVQFQKFGWDWNWACWLKDTPGPHCFHPQLTVKAYAKSTSSKILGPPRKAWKGGYLTEKHWVYTGRTYFLNIFYAPNITKLGCFILGPILVVQISVVLPFVTVPKSWFCKSLNLFLRGQFSALMDNWGISTFFKLKYLFSKTLIFDAWFFIDIKI